MCEIYFKKPIATAEYCFQPKQRFTALVVNKRTGVDPCYTYE